MMQTSKVMAILEHFHSPLWLLFLITPQGNDFNTSTSPAVLHKFNKILNESSLGFSLTLQNQLEIPQ